MAPPSTSCPSDSQLEGFAVSALPESERAQVAAHLEGCAACRDRVDEVLGRTSASGPHAIEPTLPSVTDELDATRISGGGSASADRPLAPGARVGRYWVMGRLGAGGMGVVYTAYDPELDRKIALKLLRRHTGAGLEDTAGTARLMREAQALAKLSHPNVVAVHDVGTSGDRIFIAMELAEGATLSEWLRDPHPWRERLAVAMESGEGLAAAHRVGLIHRDFKPDNVLVGADGRTRVLDFGLARADGAVDEKPLAQESPVADSANAPTRRSLALDLTQAGTVMGTPGYMAPEQYRGAPADARSDQFGFAATLYEALYGRRPFRGATLAELAEATGSGRLPPPPSDTDVPGRLWPVVRRGLEVLPDRRFSTLAELLRALREASHPWPVRHARGLVVAAVVLLCAGSALGYGLSIRARKARCAARGAAFESLWQPARKARMEQAFLATGAPNAQGAWDAFSRTIGAWIHRGGDLAERACSSPAGSGVEARARRGMEGLCLDQHRAQAAALLALYDAPTSALVRHAASAAANLPRIAECGRSSGLADVVALPPPEEKQAVAGIRAGLAQVTALELAGNYPEGLTRARALVKRARAVGYFPALARVELSEADVARKGGAPEVAAQAVKAAMRDAETGGDRATLARAWTLAIVIESYARGNTEAAAIYSNLAEGLVAGMADPDPFRMNLENAVGISLLAQHRADAAIPHLTRALALRQKVLGPEDVEVGAALNNLAIAEDRLKRFPGAEAHLEQALAIESHVLGPSHPRVSSLWLNLAVLHRREGRLGDALAEYHHVLGLRAASGGTASLGYARALGDMVEVELRLGQVKTAVAHARRALELKEKLAGSTAPTTLDALVMAATAEEISGQPAVALELVHRLLAVIDAGHGDGIDRADALAEQADILATLGRRAEAIRSANEALRLFGGRVGGRTYVGRARFALARALWADPRQRARARKLLRGAGEAMRREDALPQEFEALKHFSKRD